MERTVKVLGGELELVLFMEVDCLDGNDLLLGAEESRACHYEP
jgi:hypothetical protein